MIRLSELQKLEIGAFLNAFPDEAYLARCIFRVDLRTR